MSIVVLSQDDTRLWHSIFSRELREHNRGLILARCESSAREAGATNYIVYDAYESLVARGEVAQTQH
jgi:hypothetical protein